MASNRIILELWAWRFAFWEAGRFRYLGDVGTWTTHEQAPVKIIQPPNILAKAKNNMRAGIIDDEAIARAEAAMEMSARNFRT